MGRLRQARAADPVHHSGDLRSGWPAAVVVIVGLAATGVAYRFAEEAERQRVEDELALRVEWRAKDIERKIDNTRDPLNATAILVASKESFDTAEFHRFAVQARGLDESIRALIWAPRITRAQRAGFEAELRRSGLDGAQLFELSQDGRRIPVGERDEHYPILINVSSNNLAGEALIGFDFGANPVRAKAAMAARDAGRPAATAYTPSVNIQNRQPTYVVFYPIYAGGKPPDSVEERRGRLRGFVVGTYQVLGVLAAAVAGTPDIPEIINFHMTASDRGDDARSVDGSPIAVFSPTVRRIQATADPADLAMQTAYRFTRAFDVMGQHWRMDFLFPADVVAANRTSGPYAWLAAGFLLTGLLGVYVARERWRMMLVQGVVDERTRELRSTNTELRAVVDSSPLAIVSCDTEYRIVTWNQAAERIFGYAAAEVIGRRYPVVPEGGWEEIERMFRRIAQGETLRDVAVRRRHKDGRMLDVVFSAAALYDAERRMIGAVYVLEDVTEKRKFEVALRHSEEIARGVIETALDAFIRIDHSGRVLEWNRRAEAIFGWSPDEAVGARLSDLIIPPSDREAHERGMRHFLATGQGPLLNKRIEVAAVRKNGSQVRVEVTITPMRVADGYIFNAFLRDLTERLAAEAQLRQAQKMEAVGQLTGGIAHDFNNVLGVVIGSLDLQLEAVENGTKAKALGTAALDAALRGAELVQRLLAFSRNQPLRPEIIDLGEIARGMEPLLRRTLGERITVTMRIGGGLWPVMADRAQFENAVLNLAINARDAMPSGGRLTIACANVSLDDAAAGDLPVGDFVTLSVNDTGTGIRPEMLPRVFEPFFTTKAPGKGSGLGLSMVYGYARQSGGTVKIYSELGLGTDVRIYLPRATAPAAELQAAEQPAAPPAAPPQMGKERILVVEDKADVRAIALQLLGGLGYRIVAAEDAAAALAVIDRGEAFDLLFTDLVMPGAMNGIDLAREVRRRFPAMPIVFTSGFSDPETIRTEAASLRATIIGKPYRKSELATHLRAMLDRGPLSGA